MVLVGQGGVPSQIFARILVAKGAARFENTQQPPALGANPWSPRPGEPTELRKTGLTLPDVEQPCSDEPQRGQAAEEGKEVKTEELKRVESKEAYASLLSYDCNSLKSEKIVSNLFDKKSLQDKRIRNNSYGLLKLSEEQDLKLFNVKR